MSDVPCVLIHDNFQNFAPYQIPKAQLVIADIPYNIGADFYASRPDWYVDGDNKNGASNKAHKAAFHTDYTFNIAEFFHFCSKLLKKEPKTGEKDAPCMIVFCSFQQIPFVISEAEKNGFKNYIPLVFCKNYSPHYENILIMRIIRRKILSEYFKKPRKLHTFLTKNSDNPLIIERNSF